MRTFRFKRVSSLIRERLSWIIEKELEIPGALTTLTEVEVDRKLDHAAVKVSVFPSEKAKEVMETLRKRAGELQFRLSRQMNIKPMPRISFEIDRGIENAAVVEKLLIRDNNQ